MDYPLNVNKLPYFIELHSRETYIAVTVKRSSDNSVAGLYSCETLDGLDSFLCGWEYQINHVQIEGDASIKFRAAILALCYTRGIEFAG